MATRQVVVTAAVRAPIGKFGGSLKEIATVDLGAAVVRAAVARAGIDGALIEQAFIGNVIHTDIRDMYLARAVAITGGLAQSTPALTLNRVCGSGLQAIISAAQAILLGDIDVALAGGVESMSRAPYWLPTMRWGQRMQNGTVIDPMAGAVTDPFNGCAMGVTAENVAKRYGITRLAQDEMALASSAPPRRLRRATLITKLSPSTSPSKGAQPHLRWTKGCGATRRWRVWPNCARCLMPKAA